VGGVGAPTLAVNGIVGQADSIMARSPAALHGAAGLSAELTWLLVPEANLREYADTVSPICCDLVLIGSNLFMTVAGTAICV